MAENGSGPNGQGEKHPLNVLGHLTTLKVPIAQSKQLFNTLDNAVTATPASQLHQNVVVSSSRSATRAQARLGQTMQRGTAQYSHRKERIPDPVRLRPS